MHACAARVSALSALKPTIRVGPWAFTPWRCRAGAGFCDRNLYKSVNNDNITTLYFNFTDDNCSCSYTEHNFDQKQTSDRIKHTSHKGSHGGGEHYPHMHPSYTGPLVRSMNQSKIFINIGDDVSLKIEVWSNLRAHIIF